MIAPRAGAATEPASHYVLRATLDPAARTLEAEVQLDVPAESAGRSVEFLLSSSLHIIAA
ncbi:MAG: hypothetical protein ACKOCF_00325 [Gammaproteobacteria bacterium]